MNSTEPITIWSIIKLLLPYILPALLSAIATYFAAKHNFNIEQQSKNVDVRRERFLKKISTIEEFIGLFKELGYLNIIILRVEKLITSYDSNLEALRKNKVEIESLLSKNNIKVDQNSNPVIYDTQEEGIANLISELNGVNEEIDDIESQRKEALEEAPQIRKKFDDIVEKMEANDIGAAGAVLDQTGELADNLLKLMKLYTDADNPTMSSARIIELRTKIDHLLTDLISNFS